MAKHCKISDGRTTSLLGKIEVSLARNYSIGYTLSALTMSLKDLMGNEPRSLLGTWFLLYLPGLLFVGLVFILFAPHHGWSLAGTHLLASAYTIYGGAEKHCVRVVMSTSVPVRLCVASVLLGAGWDRDSGGRAAYFSYLWAGLEILTGIPALWYSVQEKVSAELQQKLDRRTTADATLAANVRLPRHTRAVVCAVSSIEMFVGILHFINPMSMSWFVPIEEADETGFDGMRAYGLASSANAAVILIAVGISSTATMKWWCATYHLIIALFLLPLRIFLGLHLSATWLFGLVHIVIGIVLSFLPSTSNATSISRKEGHSNSIYRTSGAENEALKKGNDKSLKKPEVILSQGVQKALGRTNE